MREFLDKFATYLLESESPVAVTRPDTTVDYFIPGRRKRSEADKDAFSRGVASVAEILDAEGITEDAAVAGFKEFWTRHK